MGLVTRAMTNQYEELILGDAGKTIPIYFVRYEDLLVDPKPVLEGLLSFMFEVEDIKGTVLEKRIHDSCAKGTESKSVYKLKSTSKNVNKNIDKYAPEDLDKWKKQLRDFLYYFGYVNHPTEEHHTPIFEYGDGLDKVPHDMAKLNELFYGFKEHNKRMIAKVAKRRAEGGEAPVFKFNETFRERFKPTTLPNIADNLNIKLTK